MNGRADGRLIANVDAGDGFTLLMNLNLWLSVSSRPVSPVREAASERDVHRPRSWEGNGAIRGMKKNARNPTIAMKRKQSA